MTAVLFVRTMEILYKNKSLIAINKPAGVPVQPDPTTDKDAMTMCAEILAEEGENNALWLVHRLDRVVGGTVVFARNKQTAAALSELFSSQSTEKEYLAVVEGVAEGGMLEDLLFKDTAKGKAFVVDRKRAGVKEAKLEYTPLQGVESERGVYTLIRVKLHTGRFHQIRAQLSSRGMPIVGDGKYGSHDNRAKMPALFSCRLAFTTGGKTYDIKKSPDNESYPWSLFDEANYD